MRRGATLPELAIALLVMGLMLGIALPRIQGLTDSLAVDQAAHEIAAAHRRARMSAILRSHVLELTIDADSLILSERGDTTHIWRGAGPSASRVALAGPRRTLIFSPVGITMGLSNASYRLTRGAASRTVIVSRLGRVRIVP
ncbi:MAG TPA: GspH/FimT family pseudopilin [Gemmatimonadales bacterium]|nr:GspH/FimT family pseudopilin [Gemmatimonadales bacterium]